MFHVTCLTFYIIPQSFQAHLGIGPLLGHERFLPCPFQFIIYYRPIIRRFIVLGTDNVVK
jgi:hypothetical protein